VSGSEDRIFRELWGIADSPSDGAPSKLCATLERLEAIAHGQGRSRNISIEPLRAARRAAHQLLSSFVRRTEVAPIDRLIGAAPSGGNPQLVIQRTDMGSDAFV